MNSRQLRVGVVGFGKMGLLHAGLISGLSRSRLAAVADNAEGVLDAFAVLKPEVAVYKDHERMLEVEGLDAIFITSPTHLHVPMALACLERRLPFFVEKPLSPRGTDTKALLDALGKAPVINMVGYMARFIGSFRKAKEVVTSKALGKLIHLRATMYVAQLFKSGKGWRYEEALSGGGVLITQNSHLIDLLLWLFGPIDSVNGHVKSWYSKNVDDFAHAYLQFASGLSGYIDTSWSMRHHRMVDISLNVQGENGTLSVTDDSVQLFLDDRSQGFPGGWSVWRKPNLSEGVEIDIGGPEYTRQDVEFLTAVAETRMPDCDVRSAYLVQQVVDAIYQSSQASGKSILISQSGVPHA